MIASRKMGKYMRKEKTTWEVAVMEVTQSLGVRTRAKTLALKKLSPAAASPTAAVATTTPTPTTNSSSFLQLRNRRLEKPPIRDTKRRKPLRRTVGCLRNPRSNVSTRASSRLRIGHSATTDSASRENGRSVMDKVVTEIVAVVEEGIQEKEVSNHLDSGIEASFGENFLDFDGRERGTRETTPCSFIRNPDCIRTPGSTTRSPEMNRILQNSEQRRIPTAHEIDAFFAAAEEKEHREFIEKYNYDPVNDKPLPGRYEWVKLDR